MINSYRLALLMLWVLSVCAHAQQMRVYDSGVKSVRMMKDGAACDFPVIPLDGSKRIDVSFDDLRHDYREFYYHIEHVSADFEPSDGIFESDYVRSANDRLPVLQYEPSMGTSVLYNHYSFQIPNAEMRPLISGNYKLVVNVENEDGEEEVAFETYFAVTEQSAPIILNATTNTEIDHNNSHQQLELEVETGAFNLYRPEEEILIRARQNGRWIEEVFGVRPTAQMGTRLLWQHSRDLIFPAGNEFRRFEQFSVRYPGLKVDRVGYETPYYYTTLMSDRVRRNYLYQEDQNGLWVVRSEYGGDADTEADYMWTRFTLESPLLQGMDVYIDGIWTGHQLVDDYRMTYNHAEGCYEAVVLLKQGYYSYQYLAVPMRASAKRISLTAPIEGDFYQTENRYDVYVYLRERGARYDRLVGWRKGQVNAK